MLPLAVAIGVVATLAAYFGYPDVAMIASGALLVLAALLVGSLVLRRLEVERDPSRRLRWDLLLIGVVLLALVGVGLMAAPWPAG